MSAPAVSEQLSDYDPVGGVLWRTSRDAPRAQMDTICERRVRCGRKGLQGLESVVVSFPSSANFSGHAHPPPAIHPCGDDSGGPPPDTCEAGAYCTGTGLLPYCVLAGWSGWICPRQGGWRRGLV